MTVRDNVIKSINTLIAKEGGNKSSFANKVGVTRGAVTNWTSGQNAPDIEMIANIARTYDVPLSDVLEGNVSDIEYAVVSLPRNTAWVEIPYYGSIAAGVPIEMMDIDDTYLVPARIASEHPNSGVLRICGNSWDREIPNDYMVVVDFDIKHPENNHEPFAVSIDDSTATVKAIEELENGIRLLPNSYDPTIKPMTFDYSNDEGTTVSILGKVVWAFAPFDYRF